MFELTSGQSGNMVTSQNTANLIQKFPPPYLIVGMGKSGSAAKRLLLAAGVESSSLFTFDDKVVADFQSPELALATAKPKTLVVSPGYRLKQPWLIQAQTNGLQITSELTLAHFFLSTEKLIGVTGSVGKSTTCALLGDALDKINESVLVCGNFGYPLADYAADLLEHKTLPRKWLVVELSSYQLENCEDLALDCGVLTSLTPNHLERYPTKAHYYASKLHLFRLSKNIKVCGTESPGLFAFLNELAQGLHTQALSDVGIKDLSFLKNLILAEQKNSLSATISSNLQEGKKFFDLPRSENLSLVSPKTPKLIGRHNQINILICMTVLRCLGLADRADQALASYPGLSHRLENLGERRHILFINDSKATTLESVITAASTLSDSYPDRKGWLLIGGRDKNLPWQDLAVVQKNPRLQVVFFGECGSLAQEKSQIKGDVFPSLSVALQNLSKALLANDIVLLSPGGTSFDEFKSFEARGDFFKNWVNNY